MPNMSYCRWQNVGNDMSDCIEAIEDVHHDFDGMSYDEQRGVIRCARNAQRMLEQLPVEILAKAGINMERLPSQEIIASAEPAELRAA